VSPIHEFISLPLGVRLALVSLAGMLLAALVNWATYSLAYEPTFRSPWSRRHLRDENFGPSDRVPILGWWRLRRMAPTLGQGFWIRPLLVELAARFSCLVGIVGGGRRGLLTPRPPAGVIGVNLTLSYVLHCQFLVHLVLGTFMLAASLIDADERNIPDAVTVTGTLVGLMLATLVPLGALTHAFDPIREHAFPLNAARPSLWPADWFGRGEWIGSSSGSLAFGSGAGGSFSAAGFRRCARA